MKYQSNITKLYSVYYCIRATCFDSYRIIYRVYQNDWSGFEVDYIHKYGEQKYKY